MTPAVPPAPSRDGAAPQDAPRAAPQDAPRSVRVRAASSGFSTFREGSLHAALKAIYAGAEGRVESLVDGFVVDVELPDEIVEIQTASLTSIRRKLDRLVDRHRVLLVHPIALEKWLVRVDADGAIVSRRRSPKRGLPLDAFDQLVALGGLVAHPNLRLDIVLTREDEIRGPIPEHARYRYPREWWRLDRRLLEIVETIHIDRPADLHALLPHALLDPFTTADLVAMTGRSKRLAMRTTYCLEKSGAARRLGRRGRLYEYELSSRG